MTAMNIGLIAHDAKKKLMQNFCIAYRGILSKHSLYATETTGALIESETLISINFFRDISVESNSFPLRLKAIKLICLSFSEIRLLHALTSRA